ncbi:MAG: PAS domain S-box protein [Verrucomicrobiota bacterium]|nr:PAS domain S-box protein [Verrucomicrobiota bacterium]
MQKGPGTEICAVCFYTATFTDPKDEELALSIGADRFVVKPVENEAFIEIISSLVSSEVGVRLRQPVSPDVERPTLECDTGYLQQYNQALVRKLEDKLVQLDATKRELEEEIRRRERVEVTLRQSEQHLKDVYEKIPAGYHSLDPQGRLLDVKPFWLQMFGYAREEVIGRPLTDFLTADSRAKFERLFPQFRDDNKTASSELEFRCKNGEVRTIEVRGVFAHDDEGRPSHSHCLLADVTERSEAQKQLQQSQERLAMAIESTGLGTWDWDLVTGKIVWGGHHARLFGLRPDEFNGAYECFEARLHPEDKELVSDAIKRALENRHAYECEYRVIWPDGSVHWILGHGRFTYDSDGRAVRMVGVVRETTQQRLAQDRLKESEQRFRSLYDNSVMGLYRTTPDGRIVMANPALVRLLGYSSFEKLAQINLETEGFHPRYPRSLFKEAIEREGTVPGLESAWVRKDASIVYVRVSAQPVRDQHGKIVFYDGTVEDITEYRQAQLWLERQAALLEAATDAIHVRSPDGVVSYWNSASEHTLGWKREEALGRKITELGVKDVAAFTAAESALLKERAWSGEMKFETKGGKPLIMFCRRTLLPEKPGEPAEILAIQTDIAEKKDIEARYLRAQRLEGIGALASGIAHDLNNVLSPIVLGASLLRDKSISPEFQASIEMIQSSAQRGRTLCGNC